MGKTSRILLRFIAFFTGACLVAIGYLMQAQEIYTSMEKGSPPLMSPVSIILFMAGLALMIVSAYMVIPETIVIFTGDDLLKLLSEDEIKVLKLIASRGELSHTDIVKETGFSHAKVTRITRKLERMRLINQTRIGRRKIVRGRSGLRGLLYT